MLVSVYSRGRCRKVSSVILLRFAPDGFSLNFLAPMAPMAWRYCMVFGDVTLLGDVQHVVHGLQI